MSRTADRVRRLLQGLAGTFATPETEEAKTGLRVGMASHVGPRKRNEDFAAMSWQADFFAVSDGIGGAPFGDVMSRVACNAAVRAFDEGADVLEAFAVANEAASLVSDLLGSRSGATLLLAERKEWTLRMVTAGDTRAYLWRGGHLEAVTGTGRAHPNSNALDKAVGYGLVEPDEAIVDLIVGDRVLLCTDGVWESIDEGCLCELLGSDDNAPLVADNIAWEAARVGNDNCTCICVFVDEATHDNVTPAEGLGSTTPEADTPTTEFFD